MNAIAAEAQQMVVESARPFDGRETIKARMNRAARNLGLAPGDWRIKAAWYGEAGSWGAAAFRDFQDRFLALEAKKERAGRARSQAAAALADLRQSLSARADADFFGDAVEGIDHALGAEGGGPLPVGGRDRPTEQD